MKKYTLVKFLLAGETISRYFEGRPALWQINSIVGFLPIIDIQHVKGDFQADYIKAKNVNGYTAS